MGFIIMEPEDTPPMSGSNAICVATVLLDAGILPMSEPETRLTLEAPAGLVAVAAECRAGKAERITLANVPAFADRLDAPLEVAGLGTLRVDVAYGGDSFVIVDAAALGFAIRPDEARDLAESRHAHRRGGECAARLRPSRERRNGITSRSASSPARSTQRGGALAGANAVVVRPGKIDRSPTGTGCSARMAVAPGARTDEVGDRYVARSIIGSTFDCAIAATQRSQDGRRSCRRSRARLDHRDASTHA